jgi:hypothetical protein
MKNTQIKKFMSEDIEEFQTVAFEDVHDIIHQTFPGTFSNAQKIEHGQLHGVESLHGISLSGEDSPFKALDLVTFAKRNQVPFHVGIIVTREMIGDPLMIPGELYVWDCDPDEFFAKSIFTKYAAQRSNVNVRSLVFLVKSVPGITIYKMQRNRRDWDRNVLCPKINRLFQTVMNIRYDKMIFFSCFLAPLFLKRKKILTTLDLLKAVENEMF